MAAYEERATLFLDLLGFRDLIKKQKEDDVLESLRLTANSGAIFQSHGSPGFDFKVTTFSDSIVCSTKQGANSVPAAFLTFYAAKLALELLDRNILVRGALTVGKLYHHDQVVFGPALIEAYEMESQLAQYPRIVVPQELCDSIDASLWLASSTLLKGSGLFRKDFDGIYHVDVLGPSFIDCRPSAHLKGDKKRTIEKLGRVTSNMIDRACQGAPTDRRVATKYGWLRSYFEDCSVRFNWKTKKPTTSAPLRDTVEERVRQQLQDILQRDGADRPLSTQALKRLEHLGASGARISELARSPYFRGLYKSAKRRIRKASDRGG